MLLVAQCSLLYLLPLELSYLGDIDMIDSFSGLIFEIYDREISSRTKPGTFSAMFLPQTNDDSWLAIVAMPM